MNTPTHYDLNREKKIQQVRDYRNNPLNKEKIKERARLYYIKNKEKIKIKQPMVLSPVSLMEQISLLHVKSTTFQNHTKDKTMSTLPLLDLLKSLNESSMVRGKFGKPSKLVVDF